MRSTERFSMNSEEEVGENKTKEVRNLGIYREISIFMIGDYTSALVYTYSAFILGTSSDISRSDILEAVSDTAMWMQVTH